MTSRPPLRLSLCLMTWNEIEGCRADVPLLPRTAFEEVFAIDGGSTDGTVEYLASQGIQVFRQEMPTYNGAYISAFLHCTTDALVIFHPKGSIDSAILLKFRPYFAQGYDHVIASRSIRGAVNEEDGKLLRPRKWFVRVLALAAALGWRRKGVLIWTCFTGVVACAGMPSGASTRGRRVSQSIWKWWCAVTGWAFGRPNFP